MATEVLELVIQTRGVSQSSRDFDGLNKSVSGVRSALGFLRNALVVFSAVRAFSGIVSLIDSFTEMTTKLKLVTNNTEELTAVTQELFKVSQQTRTSMEGNVTLFNRMARATTFLHLNYKQLIDSTRTVSQLIKVSGATTQEAQGAMVQFSQALASNRLSGDELRTVLEQLPRLADVIGKEFNISGAALRGLANSNPGIITTEKIMRAIANAAGETNSEFEKVVPTISDGFTLISNSLNVFIGRLNQAGGVGAFIFDVLRKISENIDLVAAGLITLGSLAVFNVLASQALAFAQNVGLAGGAVLRLVNFMTGSIGTLIRAFAVLALNVASVFTGEAIGRGSQLVSVLVAIGNAAKATVIALAGFAVQFGRVAAGGVIAALSSIRTLLLAVALGANIAGTSMLRFAVAMTFQSAIASVTALTTAFRGGLIPAILGAASAMGRLALAVLANPLFIGAAIVIGTVITLFFLLRDRVEKLIDSFGGLRGVVNNVLAFIQTSVQILFTRFDLLWKAIQESAFDAFQSIKKVFADFLDFVSRGIKTVSFGKIDLGQFDFEKPKSEFAGAGAELGKAFSDSFKENLAADPIKRIAETAESALDFLSGLKNGSATDPNILLNKPPGQNTQTPDSTKDVSTRIANLRQQIENFLSRVSPEFDISSKILRITTLFERFVKVAGQQELDKITKGLGSAEILKRIIREEIGIGNALSYRTERENILQRALEKKILTEREYGELSRKNQIEFLEAQRTVEAGVELAVLNQQEFFNQQQKISQGAVETALEAGKSLKTLEVQTQALQVAMDQGVISGEQYTRTIRDLRIAALGQQLDATSGINRGLLEVQKNFADVASKTAELVTGSFKRMEDSLVNFVKTGKLSFGDLSDFILDSLLRIAIQQAILKPMSDFLGMGGGGNSGISDLIGGFFSGGGGAAASATGAAAGAIPSLGVFGFADGGSFQVGGQGGTDSQLVAFRASPNEQVTIETPEQQNARRSGGGVVIESFQFIAHGVQDFDSFKRNEGQIATRVAQQLNRAVSRNG